MLFITQYYRPELVGSAPFCADIAEGFAQAHRRTTVLTGLPNYPDGEVFAAYRDGSKRRELINGVRVERLPIWVPKKRSASARIASELWFLILGIWALLSRRVRRQDLVLSLCPSILAVLIGLAARRPGGCLVAIVHDIQSGLAEGLSLVKAPFLLRAMRYTERAVLNRVDLIIVLTDEMKEHLRGLGVTCAIEVFPIWADIQRIPPLYDTPRASVRLVYSGSFGRKQKIDQITAVASELKKRAPAIDILLRGRGREFEKLKATITHASLGNVQFADLVAAENLFDHMSASDIHLVVHDPLAAKCAIPSKLYNILAAGLPCIVQAPRGTALSRLQQESRGFLRVEPGNPSSLVDATLRLASDPALCLELGRNGRRYVEHNCARTDVLTRLFSKIAGLPRTAQKKQPRGALIFEPEVEGHSEEWLRHLVRYAKAHAEVGLLWIVTSPELCDRLTEELRGMAGDRVRLLPLEPRESFMCRFPWLLVNGFARWWVARRYLKRTHAAALHFLSLDLLAVPLALGLPFKSRAVSGILFRPSTHYRFLGQYDPTRRERLRDLRKQILYRVMLSRSAVQSILTIDPYFAPYAARFFDKGRKVQSLADPANRARKASTGSARLAPKIPRDRVVFILFGYLTERKGTLVLLDAIRLLPVEVASRAAVVLAGRVDPLIDAAVQEKLAAAREARPTLHCHVENRRLDDAEIEALVARADVVLAPYQRFVGPSGVMLWAARKGKPILTQDFGVLGTLVKDHRLGLAADCSKQLIIAEAITQFIRQGPEKFIDENSARDYAAEHTPEKFADAIFANLAASTSALRPVSS